METTIYLISLLKNNIKEHIKFSDFYSENLILFKNDTFFFDNKNILKELFLIVLNNKELPVEKIYEIYMLNELFFDKIDTFDFEENTLSNVLLEILNEYYEIFIYPEVKKKNKEKIGFSSPEDEAENIKSFGLFSTELNIKYPLIDGVFEYGLLKNRIIGNIETSKYTFKLKKESIDVYINNYVLDVEIIKSLLNNILFKNTLYLYSTTFLNSENFLDFFINNFNNYYKKNLKNKKKTSYTKHNLYLDDSKFNIMINDCEHLSFRIESEENIEEFKNQYCYINELDGSYYCRLCNNKIYDISYLKFDYPKNKQINMKNVFANTKYEKFVYSYYTIKTHIIIFSNIFKILILIPDDKLIVSFLDILFHISENINDLKNKYSKEIQFNQLYFVRLTEDLFNNQQRGKELYEDLITINLTIIFLILYIYNFSILNILKLFKKYGENFLYEVIKIYLERYNKKFKLSIEDIKILCNIYLKICEVTILNFDKKSIFDNINKIKELRIIKIDEETDLIYKYNNNYEEFIKTFFNRYNNNIFQKLNKYVINPVVYYKNILSSTKELIINEEFNNIFKNLLNNKFILLKFENIEVNLNSIFLIDDTLLFNRKDGKQIIKKINLYEEKLFEIECNKIFSVLFLTNFFFFIDTIPILFENYIKNIYIKFLFNHFNILVYFDEMQMNELLKKYILIIYTILKRKNIDFMDWVNDVFKN